MRTEQGNIPQTFKNAQLEFVVKVRFIEAKNQRPDDILHKRVKFLFTNFGDLGNVVQTDFENIFFLEFLQSGFEVLLEIIHQGPKLFLCGVGDRRNHTDTIIMHIALFGEVIYNQFIDSFHQFRIVDLVTV